MIRDEIFALLKTKFDGVDDATIGRVADKLAKTATDASAAVDGCTFAQVLEMYGDSRATEASLSAVRNYERKHGLKDGKPIEVQKQAQQQQNAQPQNENNGGGEVAELLRELKSQNELLKARLDGIEAKGITKTRMGEIGRIVEKLPEALRKPYSRISVDGLSDEDYTSLKNEISAEVEQLAQAQKASGAVFQQPKFVSGPVSTKELSEEQMSAIAKREGVIKAGEQPF